MRIQTEKGSNPEFGQQSCLITRCGYHLKSTCTLTLKMFPTLDDAQNYYQPTPNLTFLLLLFTEYWPRFAPSEHLNHARCDDCPPLFTSPKTRNCSIFTGESGGGRLPTNSKGPTSDTEGVLAAWGARHYWSRSRIGGRGGRGGCFSYSSSSFCQPAPNVCQRSNALQSGHQLRSFGSCGFGACQYVLFGVH